MDLKVLDEIKYVTKGVLIFDIIVASILIITSNFEKAMLLGLIFGSIIAILNFRLLALAIGKAVDMPTHKAQMYTSLRYVLRMTITGVVLIVAATAQHLSILGTAIGLLSPKFVILSKTLLIDKLKRKEA